MNLARRKKLSIVVFVLCVVMIATGLVLFALRQNINLYYTPASLLKEHPHSNLVVRLGGMVVKGSVKHDAKSLNVQFVLTDFKRKVRVQYKGVLPALFREGQGIVTKGTLSDKGEFTASEVLAKHDEKYMPPDITKKEVS